MVALDDPELLACLPPVPPALDRRLGSNVTGGELDEWVQDVDSVSAQIKGIIDGTITDFGEFDKKLELKERAKQIRAEELEQRRRKFYAYGTEGKGEGTKYKWWCKRCFVEYLIDLPQNKCMRCQQSDKMMSQQERRDELMGKLDDYKKTRATHQFRKDKWIRWKKSQRLLGRSRNINYKAWEFWEPDTETEDEGDPIVPKDNPEFQAMEADIKDRQRKSAEKAKTAERFREKGNQAMKDGDFVTAIEHYEEGLEYQRGNKALWTNKALAELKVFRWHDAIASCNKVIEYSEIFEDGFKKSADACFKAFVRRAAALRALHRWSEAVEDLEDAVKLFPKDREAADLLEKTRLAAAEAAKAESLQAEANDVVAPAAAAAVPPTEAAEPATEQAPQGPIRIEIEESEDEDDDEAGQVAAAASRSSSALAKLSRKEFRALLDRLGDKESERVLFCARRGAGAEASASKKEDTRKVDLKKVEEVLEPSRLDEAIKDAERCAVLWKKRLGRVVPLRDDVKHLSGVIPEEQDQEADAFLRVVAPRVVAILHVLAVSSDHHCALTAPAVRHVWPLLSSDEWRHGVLELLLEWSQRGISARAMAEFAARHPEPHLRLLVEAVSKETKENMLPPGFEDRAKIAAQRFEAGAGGLEGAFDEIVSGLSKHSPAELAVSTLGNICLAGQGLPAFREQVTPFLAELVPALGRQLKPMNWRLCGRAAGAVCNLLRLGDDFAEAVENECTVPLATALRAELGEGGESEASAPLMRALRQGGLSSEVLGGGVPGMDSAAIRLFAAVINLLTVRPSAAQKLLELGVLDLAVRFMDPAKAREVVSDSADAEDGPEALVARASVLAGRLLSRAPSALSQEREADLLRQLFARLDGARAIAREAVAVAGSGTPNSDIEQVELTVRTLAVLLTKTPGALDRLSQKVARIEELPDNATVGKVETPAAGAVPFDALAARLADLACAARPREHVEVACEGGPLSRLRGNLALIFAALCEAQDSDGAPPALRDLDLAPLVEPFVDTLRKERGAVQNNIGVFVTKLAQNKRYKQRVRDANGLESLHQIQLPRVQAQKAEAERRHRIETNSDARRAEVQRIKTLRGLD